MNGWDEDTPLVVNVTPGPWVPYSPEMAVDLIGWPVEQVREVFGEKVLVRQTVGGLEFGRPNPAPDSDEVRAEVTDVIARAREPRRAPRTQVHFTGPSLATIVNGIDWNRINAGLVYALTHGGNLPPGFMRER